MPDNPAAERPVDTLLTRASSDSFGSALEFRLVQHVRILPKQYEDFLVYGWESARHDVRATYCKDQKFFG
jgi:hypothetical protein